MAFITFMSMINRTSERLKARNFFICQYFTFYEQFKFRAQLSWAWKKNLGPGIFYKIGREREVVPPKIRRLTIYWGDLTGMPITLNPLYTYGFFLLVWYNKLGIANCTYLGVSGYNLKKNVVLSCLKMFFFLYKQCRP